MLNEQHHRQLQMIASYLPSIQFDWDKEQMVHSFSVLAELLDYRMMWEKEEGVCFCNHLDGYPRILLEKKEGRIQSVWLDIDTYREMDEILKDPNDDRMNELTMEMLRSLDVVVRFLSTNWGAPFFYGEFWDPQFPRDQYVSIRMALWKVQDAHIAVQVEHQDREYPISLNMLITPEQELSSHRFDALIKRK
jgi:hypothetical protein